MQRHEILGGNVQLYRRVDGGKWHCSTSVGGKQRRATTKQDSLALAKQDSLALAKQVAEDWYLGLRGKRHAGLLKSEKTFRQAADQFLREYEIITEGERSKRWTEGNAIRLRVHLLPFFGDLGLSEITAGKVQDYRVHRISTRMEPNPHSRSNRPLKDKLPARNTLHNETVTLRMVLRTAVNHGWLSHVPDISTPYRASAKVEHRAWFSPAEYKQLYMATGACAKAPFRDRFRWSAEQVHDYVLFMTITGLRPDEAVNLEHLDVEIVVDQETGQRILEIEVRGKRGVGFCKSMPNAVRPYERLLGRAKPVEVISRQRELGMRRTGEEIPTDAPTKSYPQPTDNVFPGNHINLFNSLLVREKLKLDRDGKARTTYSLRHTYICVRLMEGADVYAVARNCRTSVEMIQKYYAAHIKNMISAAAVNVRRAKLGGRRKALPVVFEDDL
ncbi:site-specific integrase [Zavarzinia aquatilis]|uniref:Integrase n=1 Tax=Zavarzinia aquatilis TaxID=2211142 RepID=A0A317DU84_9PROT|nr:site-specific integrase [Zavarzinia aquatilis]PWR17944.1 integrase [Zavarzinia aquatilis]